MGSEPSFCDLDFCHGRSIGLGRGMLARGFLSFCISQFAVCRVSKIAASSWSVTVQCAPYSDVEVADTGSRWKPRTSTYKSRQDNRDEPTSARW